MTIISRKDALNLGLKTYFTGKPCAHGHVAPRSVSNKNCSECNKTRLKTYYHNHKQESSDRNKQWRTENRQRHLENVKKWEIGRAHV